MSWQAMLLLLLVVLGVAVLASLMWWRRSGRTRAEAVAYVKEQGIELARLPGRLRRVAADPRTPHRARWWLIGLAIYIASPIDPIPDFLPGIGFLDEAVLVPVILLHIRRLIPQDVWETYFPTRPASTPDGDASSDAAKAERPVARSKTTDVPGAMAESTGSTPRNERPPSLE